MSTPSELGLIRKDPPGHSSRVDTYDEIVDSLKANPNMWYLAAVGPTKDLRGYDAYRRRGVIVRRSKMENGTWEMYVKWDGRRPR